MEFFAGFAAAIYIVGIVYIWLANQMGNGYGGNPFLWPYRMVIRWVMALWRRDGLLTLIWVLLTLICIMVYIN